MLSSRLPVLPDMVSFLLTSAMPRCHLCQSTAAFTMVCLQRHHHHYLTKIFFPCCLSWFICKFVGIDVRTLNKCSSLCYLQALAVGTQDRNTRGTKLLPSTAEWPSMVEESFQTVSWIEHVSLKVLFYVYQSIRTAVSVIGSSILPMAC